MRQALLALMLGVVIALGLAEVASRVVAPHWREFSGNRFIRPITVPGIGGTSIAPPGFDSHFAQNNGDFRVHIHADRLGLRNPDDTVADGALWAVGDSFTFGWGVERDQTFGAVAAMAVGLPFYSVASPGTDVCGYRAQLARMPAPEKPAAVLMGLTLENDIGDYAACGKAKPPSAAPAQPAPPPPWEGFRREMEKALEPVKERLMAHSAFYNFLAVTVKRSPVLIEILVRLNLVADPLALSWHNPDLPESDIASTADQIAVVMAGLPRGTPFAVIIIPTRFELIGTDPNWTALRRRVVAALEQRRIAVVDPIERLRQAGLGKVHFSHDGHWTSEGHRIVGELAADWLKRKEIP